MKKIVSVAFCIIVLGSIGLVMKTGNVRAYQAGYTVNNYVATNACTVDGNWTTTNEWTDTAEKQLDGSLNVIFRLKYVVAPDYSWIAQYYLIEFFDDTTEDAGDFWQICYEAPVEVDGTPIGGTTPQTDCDRWDFVGHNVTGFTYYKGDGSAWVESSDYTWNTDIYIVDGFGTTPLSSTPHWIVEIMIEHLHYGIGTPQWIRLAAYDDSNSGAGVQAWPESNVNVPNDWGLSIAMMEPIPEGLTFGVIVILLSVSVLIIPHFYRKWSRTKSCSSGKLEK